MRNKCTHKFVHIDTVYKKEYVSFGYTYIRIDRFFCEKCLEEQIKKKEESQRMRPDWYIGE